MFKFCALKKGSIMILLRVIIKEEYLLGYFSRIARFFSFVFDILINLLKNFFNFQDLLK